MMNKLRLNRSIQFKKDLKKAIKQRKDLVLLESVVEMLQEQKPLPAKYRDHALGGNWNGYKECHLQPNWLLIYKIVEDELLLYLMRLGSHSDLFK